MSIFIFAFSRVFVQALLRELYLAKGRHHSVNAFASLSARHRDEFSHQAAESGNRMEVCSCHEGKVGVKLGDI